MGLANDMKQIMDLASSYGPLKSVEYDPEAIAGNVRYFKVEFFESKSAVQASTLPPVSDMPPDDVMMFAATEDIDELMKARKPE